MDGRAGGSAIKPREFSICSTIWADFLQKAIWPDLKMRKSLNTHMHIAGEHLVLRKKKKTTHTINTQLKMSQSVRGDSKPTADREQEAMHFCCFFFPSSKARQSSPGSVGNRVRGLRDFYCTVSGWAVWKQPLK